MFRFLVPKKYVIKRIEQADEEEITAYIEALIHWQRRHEPKYELVVMTLPKKDMAERIRQIDKMAVLLKRYVDAEAGSSL